MQNLIDFLDRLEDAKISYQLRRDRNFSIAVMVFVPGEIWEVDFLYDDKKEKITDVWVEKFKSDGTDFYEEEIEVLFRDFSDW